MHIPKVDQQVDSTIRTLRKQNVGIIIHDDAKMYCIFQEVRKNTIVDKCTVFSKRNIIFMVNFILLLRSKKRKLVEREGEEEREREREGQIKSMSIYTFG